MDPGRGVALPFVACFAGLVLSMVAFADLPLLGGLVGATLSGAVAVLLAREPLDGPRGAFLAGATAVAVLAALTLVGLSAAPSVALLAQPSAVLAVQAAILGLVPGTVAFVGGWVLDRRRPAAPPGAADAAAGPEPVPEEGVAWRPPERP